MQTGFARLFLILLISAVGIGMVGLLIYYQQNSKTPYFSPLLPNQEDIPSTPYVSAHGTKLYLNGEPYKFTGVNAFHLGSFAGFAGCGGVVDNLDLFFSKLRPNSMVRIWAFQGGMATNVTTKKTDWTGLDRVIEAASRNQIKLDLVLSDQGGTCDDGHWKDIFWYQEGFKKSFNDLGNNLTPLSYLDYVRLIVDRYKDSKAVAIWEPVNEPIASDCKNGKGRACFDSQICTDEAASAKALRSFFDTVGGEIKKIDSNHIVSSGVTGDGQCGAVYEDYKYLHESPGIDVASYHDYNRDTQPMPGDPWNGLQKRLDQMKLVNKPLIIGEAGMQATDNSAGCMGYAERRDKIKAKMDAQFNAGIAGFMTWALTEGVSKVCNFDIVDNDPLIDLLYKYPVSMGSFSPRPSPVSATNSAQLSN